MGSIIYVRFYPGEWLAATRGMTAAESGIYISLIAMMYDTAGPLVEDHARLARLCGASNSQFMKALEMLISDGKITRTESGLSNDRVEKELGYVSEISDVAREKAKRRWAKKSIKSKDDSCSGICSGNAGAMLISNQYISTNVDIKPPPKNKPPDKMTPRQILETVLSPKTADDVIAHRNAKRSKLTARAAELLVMEFSKVDPPELAAETMIARGWTGFKAEWMQEKGFNNGHKQTRADIAFGKINQRIAEIGGTVEHDRPDHEPNGTGLFGEMPGDY